MSFRRIASTFLMLLFICGIGFAQNGDGKAAASLGSLPASFEGDLPAADGPKIRYHLDLFPDRIFMLRMAQRWREDAPLDQIGTWAVSADGGRLMLMGPGTAPRLFSIEDADTLHMLDPAGWAIDPRSSYDLTRVEPFAPVEPRLLLGGMYRHEADGGVLHECLTGWRLPVAQEGENTALESAYAHAPQEPGEALFVTLLGRIVHRPGPEGEGTQMTLVPERFIGLWPGETCGSHYPQATVENTYGKANSESSVPGSVSD